MKKIIFKLLLFLVVTIIPSSMYANMNTYVETNCSELQIPEMESGLEVTYTINSSKTDSGDVVIVEHKTVTYNGKVVSDTIEISVINGSK